MKIEQKPRRQNKNTRFKALWLMILVLGIVLVTPVLAIWGGGSNIYAYWAFDDVSGTIVQNNVTGGANLTVNGGNWTNGILGGGYVMQGDSEVNGIFNPSGNNSYTINLWVNASNFEGQGGSQRILGSVGQDGAGEGDIAFELASGGTLGLTIRNQSTNVGSPSLTDQNEGEWQMYSITLNSTTGVFYHNGTMFWNISWETAPTFPDKFINISDYGVGGDSAENVTFDEVGVWANNALTPTEISGLYNSGLGLKFQGGAVTLNSPVDNVESIFGSWDFNCSVTAPVGENLVNISLWHNGTGTWDLNDTVNITGTSNETAFTSKDTGTAIWNCQACTDTNTCLVGDSNRTVNQINFLELNQVFSASVVEGSTETFKINISVNQDYQPSTVNLIYNNTAYEGTVNDLGSGNYTLSRTLEIPDVSGSVNNTFFWNVSLTDGITYNSSSNNQSIGLLAIDDCSAYGNQIFNITIYDEDNQTMLNGVADDTSIKLTLSLSPTGGSEVLNFSTNFTQVNPARICFQNDIGGSSYELNGVIEYSSSNRFTEFYHFQDFSLTTATSNVSIPLYNLNSTRGQEYKITYKDANFVPVEGAIFDIQRKYIEDGLFRTTEVPKTGAEGYTIAHLVSNDVIYNIIVKKDGAVLATFTDLVADCQNPALSSCSINLNSFSSSNFPSDFRNLNDISFTLTYNRSSRTVNSIYTIQTGIASTILLNVTLYDTLGVTQVCSDSLTSSGGALSCVIPASFGNSSVIAKLYKDGDEVGRTVINLNEDPRNIYGANIILIALIIFLTFAGIGLSFEDPMAFGVVLILGSVVMITLNIMYTPSWGGAGFTFLWFFLAIILTWIKGGSRQ